MAVRTNENAPEDLWRSRRRRLKFVNTLLDRGRVALREHRIKTSISDYSRLVQKIVEEDATPRGQVMWFDNLDSPEAKAAMAKSTQRRRN